MGPPRVRVAHVITRMIIGGAQETVLLAAALADHERFTPVLLTGPDTGSEGELLSEAAARGVDVVVVPQLVRRVDPIRDPAAVASLTRLLRKLRPQVVHTNSSKAGVVGRIAGRAAQVPAVVHTVHGWPFHAHQSPATAAAWLAVERAAAHLTDTLVTVADADRERGLRSGVGRPEQYVTVRSGLELTDHEPAAPERFAVRAELGLPQHAPVVVAVNRLSPQKDPITLVDTLVRLRALAPAVHMLVVGDGPLRSAVIQRARELDVADALHLTGLRRDVPRLLQAGDVYLSCSLWEGLPRTVIAAMASGLPVVATPVDGILDVVEDGRSGLLAPVGDADALARACARLLADQGTSRALAREGARRAQEFSATTMVRRLEAVYEDLLAR